MLSAFAGAQQEVHAAHCSGDCSTNIAHTRCLEWDGICRVHTIQPHRALGQREQQPVQRVGQSIAVHVWSKLDLAVRQHGSIADRRRVQPRKRVQKQAAGIGRPAAQLASGRQAVLYIYTSATVFHVFASWLLQQQRGYSGRQPRSCSYPGTVA